MSHFERKPLRYYWQVEILDGPGKPFSWLRLWRRVRRNRPAHFLFWFRLAEYLSDTKSRMLKSFAKGINNKLIQKHGIEIMLGARIAEGLHLSHMQGVVIFRNVQIGKNFTVRQNTTIGTDFKSEEIVMIGDNVDVGANSCIIGSGLRIGDNVKIGAMSFVNKSIPNDHVYITEKRARLLPLADSLVSLSKHGA
ncbi:serine acetyltransferase [Ectopseudomonas alcaliphila]|uniref:serine acetyltransferase n=1 Tax=Ectopseudomonas alcaliphila TaxID=101564 RepID=UPI002781E06A|nr:MULTISPECIES: serine acetyltransferase [Pseudomonas]MDP9938463.1 serine acetyltransferase [Pseudomonas sp. 3400]MDR7010686.1 serine acetyltransferase [Pseudomonas alcaliphila]